MHEGSVEEDCHDGTQLARGITRGGVANENYLIAILPLADVKHHYLAGGATKYSGHGKCGWSLAPALSP